MCSCDWSSDVCSSDLPECPDLLGNSLANIEKHLASHGKYELEYRCGVCRKLWPSWRSAITHYSKSNCRLTSITSPSHPITTTTTTSTQASSHVTVPRDSNMETASSKRRPSSRTADDEESEAEEPVRRVRVTRRRSIRDQEHSLPYQPGADATHDHTDQRAATASAMSVHDDGGDRKSVV